MISAISFVIFLSCSSGIMLTKENRMSLKAISVNSLVIFATDNVWVLNSGGPPLMMGGAVGAIASNVRNESRHKTDEFANTLNTEFKRMLSRSVKDYAIENLKKQSNLTICADSSCKSDAQLIILITAYGFANWGMYSGGKFQPTLRIRGYLLKNPPANYTIKQSIFNDDGSIKEYGSLTFLDPEKHPIIWDEDVMAGWLGGSNSNRKSDLLKFSDNLPDMELAVAEVTNEAVTKLLANVIGTGSE